MTRIVIVPSTLRAGAGRCRTVALETSGIAGRVAALPSPEGMPPEATAQLNAAAAQLRRSSASAGAGATFLTSRAQQALLADGPFGAPLELFGPGLLSPWAMPPAPPKKEEKNESGGLMGFLDGAKDELVETAVGLGKTGAGLAGRAIDGDLPVPGLFRPGGPNVSQHIPFIGDQRKELDAGLDYARRNPGKFTTAMGRDLIAYDDHARGDNAHGAGRNTVGILGLLNPAAKAASASKASRAAQAASRAEDAAAKANAGARAARADTRAAHSRIVAEGRGRNESAADYAARVNRANWHRVAAANRARLSQERLETEVQKATDAAERAAEIRQKALGEAGKTARDTARDTAAKELTNEHRKDGR